MKRLSSTLLALFAVTNLLAQRIHPDYMDGVVYFQVKADYPVRILTWDEKDCLIGTTFPFFTEIFQKYGVNDVLRPFHLFGDEGLLRIIELHFDRAQAVDSLIAALQSNEWVSYAEKVPLMRIAYKPNDPYYGNGSLNWKWYLDMIKADSAWDVQQGKSNIKVAVVDNFVWEGHPDLQIDSANACTISYDRKKGGYVYTVGTSAPPAVLKQVSSENAYAASHGTHCAGLVGAVNNNGNGIASIGGGITLMGISTANAQYPQYMLYGPIGLQWAVEHGAKVVSMSFGGIAGSQTYAAITTVCEKNGIVLVAAAGNEGDEDNPIIYPAGLPTVISVASVDGDGKLSYFSQWGPGRADIAAPGGFIKSNNGSVSYPNILSTTYCLSYLMKNYGLSNTYYDGMQGTSMAAPIVSGLVGLMLSKDSTLTPAEIKARLQRTATPLSSASAHTIDGYGYINAYRALLNEYIVLSADTLVLPKEVGSRDSIVITASSSWTLSALPAWMSANTLKGDSGKTTVVFTVISENNASIDRSVRLTFKGEGKAGSQNLSVIQTNYSFVLRIDKKQIRFAGVKGLYDTLHVYATIPWSFKNETTWLASDVQRISKDSSIVVLGTRSSNTLGKNREAYLVFSSAYLSSDTVYVVQRIPDFIKLSASQVNIGAVKGDTTSIDVLSNVQWMLRGGDSSWVFPDRTSAIDSARILFRTLSDNTTRNFRTATYTVTDGKISSTFTLKQAHNLSVIEVKSAAWTVFPNPMDDHLTCRFPGVLSADVRVYDAQGRLLKSQAVKGAEVVLNLSELAPGMYVIRYENSSQMVIKK